MKISGNSILITGGATGIGLELSKLFVNSGNEVIICGRREDKLNEAKKLLPAIHTKACDVSAAENRIALTEWIISEFPDFNILINNAGIQRMIDFTKGTEELKELHDEISINLEAPIHLSALCIPHLSAKKGAAIVNITSGLGFTPLAFVPVYCATKAALHSFSMTLRHQLRTTSVKVFEVIPPIVDTELDKGARKRRGMTHFGILAAEAAEGAFKSIENDEYEFAIGMAANLRAGSRNNPEEAFKKLNER